MLWPPFTRKEPGPREQRQRRRRQAGPGQSRIRRVRGASRGIRAARRPRRACRRLIAQLFGSDTLPRVVAFVSVRRRAASRRRSRGSPARSREPRPCGARPPPPSTTSATTWPATRAGGAPAAPAAPAGRRAAGRRRRARGRRRPRCSAGESSASPGRSTPSSSSSKGGKTRRKALTQAVSAHRRAGGNVVGLVLVPAQAADAGVAGADGLVESRDSDGSTPMEPDEHSRRPRLGDERWPEAVRPDQDRGSPLARAPMSA